MIDSAPHAFFLVGPTASGKSRVAHCIAEREGQVVVSADSMNIYRGMDIGTAKPNAEERERVDYAGVDLCDPTDKFSVAAWLAAVRAGFESGRPTIVAGGTGLYIKCLTEGFDDVPPEDEKLRAGLEALEFSDLERLAREEAPQLYEQLTEDDRRNPRRLIRILEKMNGGTLSSASADSEDAVPPSGKWNSRPKPILVGLHVERAELHRRIEQRVENMYAAGLLDEARLLMDLDLSPTARQAIGYAEAFAVLRDETSLEQAKEKTIIRTRQLAKRQMTWFRNQLNVHWIDVSTFENEDLLADAVCDAWKRSGPVSLIF